MYDSSKFFYNNVIDQSLRVQNSHHLERNATAGNQSTWTFSAWIKRSKLGSVQHIWTPHRGGDGTNESAFRFLANDKLNIYDSGATRGQVTTTAVFRDVGQWYHIVVQLDLTDSTANDRVKIYVNNVLQEKTVNNAIGTSVWGWNANGQRHRLGGYAYPTNDTTNSFDGYMAEVNFIDGAVVAPTAFGETKESIWIPKEITGLTYGANGFRMTFADSSDIGNNANSTDGTNDFTTVTGLATHDVVADSPENNFCTLNDLTRGTYPTLSQGALSLATVYSADLSGVTGTWFMKSGKWYWEIHNEGATLTYPYLGITDQRQVLTNATKGSFYSVAWVRTGAVASMTGANTFSGTITPTGGSTTVTSWTNNDIIMFALDVDARKLWIGKNGTWENGGNPVAGSGEDASWTVDTPISPVIMGYNNQGVGCVFNFGQDGTFAGNQTAQGNADENGVGDFYYSPPTGYLAMATSNLPAPGIDPNDIQPENPTDYFNALLYTGDGATSRSITGVGFAPDFVWLKSRSHAEDHGLSDTVRGATNKVEANNATVEETSTSSPTAVLTAFGSDGFTGPASSPGNFNVNGRTYVAWNWKAGGAASTNNDGTIQSSVSASTEAGFSIVSYTGTGANGTVGHGLSSAPEVILIKDRDTASNWLVYNKFDSGTDGRSFLNLNTTGAKFDNGPNSYFQDTPPTNSVFYQNNSTYNVNTKKFIAYCFHSVDGFSRAGVYRGNALSNGMFVFTGFRPAFILTKSIAAGTDWAIYDNKRLGYNVDNNIMRIGGTSAPTEQTDDDIDILSTGFKFRRSSPNFNNAQLFVFLAFAEQPFKYANAR